MLHPAWLASTQICCHHHLGHADTFFCVVDLHAITVPHDPVELKAATRTMAATYIAAGIDPNRSTVFVQSHVPAHAELQWLLNCITPIGWLNRMIQFKEKSRKQVSPWCSRGRALPIHGRLPGMAGTSTRALLCHHHHHHHHYHRHLACARISHGAAVWITHTYPI